MALSFDERENSGDPPPRIAFFIETMSYWQT